MRSMITIQLDMQHREKIAALVPQERAYVSELLSKGTIEALYMSANLLDQSGTVRLAFVDPDFTRRLDPSVIIARLKELKG